MKKKEKKKVSKGVHPHPNEKAFDSVEIGVNYVNAYLPQVMRLRLEEGEIRMYLYVNTEVKDANGNDVKEWKHIHTMYDGEHKKDFLLGMVKMVFALNNYQRMVDMTLQQKAFEQRIKVENEEKEKAPDLRK